jgi:hypothetical protein
MTIKAYRRGETVSPWTGCYKEKLTPTTDHILFNFSMPSKGGGVTEVQLQVTSESFAAVAQSMSDANQNPAVRALVRAAVGRWDLIIQAMMGADEKTAIQAIGQVLQNNKDDAVRACGTILFEKLLSESHAELVKVSAELVERLQAELAAVRETLPDGSS